MAAKSPPPTVLNPTKMLWECLVCHVVMKSQAGYDRHLPLHDPTRKHPCEHPGCLKRFTTKSALRTHTMIHTDERPFACDHPGCGYTSRTKAIITVHNNRVHLNLRPWGCKHPGCGYSAKAEVVLQRHINRIHLGLRPYKCPDKMCDFVFASVSERNSHFKNQHHPEGQKRQKKKEQTIAKLLAKHLNPDTHPMTRGYRVDLKCSGAAKIPEHLIDPDTGKPLKGVRQGKFAEIDFVIERPDGVIVLLEVDEHQHRDYGILCETSRMMNVLSSAATSRFPTDSVLLWVRYNPDRFHVNGVNATKCTQSTIRHPKLIDVVLNHQPPTGAMVHIVYLYYNVVTIGDGVADGTECGTKGKTPLTLEVMHAPDFPHVMKELVTVIVD